MWRKVNQETAILPAIGKFLNQSNTVCVYIFNTAVRTNAYNQDQPIKYCGENINRKVV